MGLLAAAAAAVVPPLPVLRVIQKLHRPPLPALRVGRDDLEEYTVGLDKYSNVLKEQLLDESVTARALVSIAGESSIGKTTLARKVYQSPEVRNHFEIRTWTMLPHKSRPADVLRDIHKQASSQLRRSPSQQCVEDGCYAVGGAKACGPGKDISNQLYKSMTGRRYLVVVDGSIAVTDWNSLRASLPDEGNGSRVALITDSAGLEVVGHAGPTYDPIELTRLSPENTYEVFRRRVFGRGDCPGRYKSRYYQDVFRITRGLPLSIVILAGVLRSKELPAEWDEVMAQLAPAREQPKSSNSRRIMSLAFDDLPHHLKSCFLYLAAMRESTPVDAQRLVRLWVAEGFVRPRRGSTMEEVGQGYLKELISRCMVQLVHKDEFGAVQTVVVHDRLHAFAQDEAQEASFIESHDSTDVLAPATVRRLAVLTSTTDRYVHLSNALPKLRSIVCDFVEGRNKPNTSIQCSDLSFLHASKFLRVIDIQGLELKKLPNDIGSMIHIRYLGLQCGYLEKLPRTIGNLVNLQSLILKGSNGGHRVLEVTSAFWRIPTLRHVVAPFALPCRALSNLYSLQTLHGVQPRGWDGSNNPLGKAANLRSLELIGLTAAHAGALEAALESLDLLVHLQLQGDSLPSSVFIIPSLRRLQSLKLLGSVDAPEGPDGAEDVRYIRPNLTRLSMWSTMVGQKFVDMLAELPSLAELTLMWDAYDGDRLAFGESGFRSLQELKLGLPELEEWTVSAASMPGLARLTLYRCAKMRMLPEALAGMRELEEVVLYSMPNMVGRIKEGGGQDHHKVKHVPVIQTIW
ncbi:probable disease resistance RPP8-like protein 2 isoform X2 [Phragmites australis]|uniref:probable disease resistance RPP8-like protein 2 isoform X2 n=1 Tax=Phragmites australis TaxID=29695 RepID=UPI002D779B06|nr:probable disease resistance RPP8-like protein 2 isoform X2 [Phragmites australis]